MSRIDDDIKSGAFASVYLIWGEESYLRRFYKNQLKRALTTGDDDMNLNLFTGKDISADEVMAQAETVPFFAPHRLILVEDSGWFSSSMEEVASFIPQIPPESILVFSEAGVDARTKLYKAVKKHGVIVECRHPDEKTLTNWILRRLNREGKKIQQTAMRYFLDNTDQDMEAVSHELEKVIAYTGEREGINLEDVQAVCPPKPEDQVFKMIDAIAEKRTEAALAYYADLLALRQEPRGILALLTGQLRRLLEIRDLRIQGYDQNTIIGKTGARPFVVQKGIRQSERFSTETLRSYLRACADALEDMNNGRIEDRLAVELLLIAFSREKKER